VGVGLLVVNSSSHCARVQGCELLFTVGHVLTFTSEQVDRELLVTVRHVPTWTGGHRRAHGRGPGRLDMPRAQWACSSVHECAL